MRLLETGPLTRMEAFPFLFGGAFIEAVIFDMFIRTIREFPFLFGGAFIEANRETFFGDAHKDFPSFLEGLSLRHRLGPTEDERV